MGGGILRVGLDQAEQPLPGLTVSPGAPVGPGQVALDGDRAGLEQPGLVQLPGRRGMGAVVRQDIAIPEMGLGAVGRLLQRPSEGAARGDGAEAAGSTRPAARDSLAPGREARFRQTIDPIPVSLIPLSRSTTLYSYGRVSIYLETRSGPYMLIGAASSPVRTPF